MKVGFLTFDKDKTEAGSSRIRVRNLLKHDSNLEELKAGVKYDAVVFQKYYWTEYAEIYDGIKILDVCDPDWLLGDANIPFVKMLNLVDGITCNTDDTAGYLMRITGKPVVTIKDRHFIEEMGEPKKHKDKSKISAVWFGYHHNGKILRSYIPLLSKYNIDLTIVSDVFFTVCDDSTNEHFKDREHFVKWEGDISEINKELRKHDFALLPKRRKLQEKYKSNNKETYAILLGLPVAVWGDDIEELLTASQRNEYIKNVYEDTKKEYDSKKSVQELWDFITHIKNGKN